MGTKPNPCEENRRLLTSFLEHSLKRAEDRVFREHIKVCPDCRTRYRETLAQAAQFGRVIREQRVAEEKELRHDELVERAMKAGHRPSHGRRFGLRLALLPVAFICLIVMWSRLDPGGALVAHWTGGEVRAAGQRLGTDRPEVALESGDWCSTTGEARARIEGPASALELGLETQVVVVDPEGVRLRLQQGELRLSGLCAVTSSFGVLEMEAGSARLDVRNGRFELECLEGELTWTGPVGEWVLAAGERLGSGPSARDRF